MGTLQCVWLNNLDERENEGLKSLCFQLCLPPLNQMLYLYLLYVLLLFWLDPYVYVHIIGSILSAGGSAPFENALSSDWADMVDGFQKLALQSRLGIPLLYGIDAVHGNNSVYGATIFPHNVGLGATRLVLTSPYVLKLNQQSLILLHYWNGSLVLKR